MIATVLAACAACGDSTPPSSPQAISLEELANDLQAGRITRDAFLAELDALDAPAPAEPLTGALPESTLLSRRSAPYVVSGELRVPAGRVLVIQDGVTLQFEDGAALRASGRLYAIGTEESPILFTANPGQVYDRVELESGPNQLVWVELERGNRLLVASHDFDTTSLVERARFDTWVDIAIDQVASGGLSVVSSKFGYQTADVDVSGETVRARNSGVITIEDCDFSYRRGYRDVIDLQNCIEGHWPIIAGNRFDGGEDDGIDLDTCSAIVVGNHVRNFRPENLDSPFAGVNGGGITGDKTSRPIILNNVIDGCYHGIGFKDGSQPFIVNNTIINSNIGVTLYQSAVDQPRPSGTMINNVLWNNRDWRTDAPQDVVLNGKWWPQYNQIDDIQGELQASSNIAGSALAGEGNLDGDPLLDTSTGVPVPGATSPALDSGLELIELPQGAPADQIRELLERDFLGRLRTREGERFPGIDRGAIEGG